MIKTNAARLLDQKGIAYRVLEYAIGDEHLDAVQVAQKVGLDPDSVFKTLVARGDKHGPCMAIVPGPASLDLKALARASGDRSVALIPLKEVTPSGGPAGIKVIRCKDKDRYYVYVDGKPTGMTCPTERIEVELGAHVVEVYDVVSDARKRYEVEVKDTRLSHRVKIE